MQSGAQLALVAIGTLAGVVYCVLGLAAVKHLPNADATDRSVGWMIIWIADFRRYTDPGKRLCGVGAVVLVVGIAAWLAFYLVDRAPS
jgi:hypothetical protein